MASKEFQELYQQHDKMLIKLDHINRASKSALYNNKWKQYNIDASKLKGINGLKKLPFISSNDLRTTWESHSIEEIILTKSVGMWYCTSGSSGNRKWMAWTFNDINRSKKVLGERLLKILKPDDIMMAVLLSSPFISGSVPYRILESTGSVGTPIEQIILSPETVVDGFGILLKRQPTIFMCTPSLALRLAEEIAKNTPQILKAQAKAQKSAKLRIASAVTKIIKVKPKQVFKKLRLGYFVSEKLEPYRKAIEDSFGLEAYDFYGFTEGFGGGFECEIHNGLHFPCLNSILEIIPEDELEKEEKDPNYIPEAILLSEVEKGMRGEIVATDFKEAIPLIRYRMRDRVEVISPEECECDRSTPRLKIIGRTDAMITIGLIRMPVPIIEDLILKKFDNGKVNIWEIFISREGFKPKLTLTVEPEYVKDEVKFKKEIYDSLYSFDLFQRGVDNELFIFDKIKVVSKLKLEVYGQGKRRKVRHHPDFEKSVKM
ncbi:MAG: phenylacetate--CoA ligase family protein [Asgard group archaeon]|nr:phenylacetate--CoA ligase family protein [Asgard group archaeon]